MTFFYSNWIFYKQRAEGTYFEELDEEGFLINGNYYKGGVLAFNDIALLWDVNKIEDLTPESLKPVTLYNPAVGTAVLLLLVQIR